MKTFRPSLTERFVIIAHEHKKISHHKLFLHAFCEEDIKTA